MMPSLDERDLAQVARVGGRYYRQYDNRVAGGMLASPEIDGYIRRDAQWIIRGVAHQMSGLFGYGRPRLDEQIPQDAVAWPVYRAAFDDGSASARQALLDASMTALWRRSSSGYFVGPSTPMMMVTYPAPGPSLPTWALVLVGLIGAFLVGVLAGVAL